GGGPGRGRVCARRAGAERPVSAVVEGLGLGQPQASKPLRVLREVGLVSVRVAGRQRVYRLRAEGLKPIHDWVGTFERFWDRQLDRIKARAERGGKGRPADPGGPDEEG